MTPSPEQVLKLFVVSNQLAERELDRVEKSHQLSLGRDHRRSIGEEDYYPQIERSIRRDAAEMAPHYEVFYSLERSIRAMVVDTLSAAEPEKWWRQRIPEDVRVAAELAQQQEIDSGVTPRSEDLIDYTNFGELGKIIGTNWDLFDQTFTSKKAVGNVMRDLNTLRGPIAHCSPLAEDEVVRLRLSVKAWYRIQS
jgi:Swt1-like HEPN